MNKVRAIYENGLFRPTGPVELPDHCKVEFEPRLVEQSERSEDKTTDLLPQGTPISRDFWESPTLDELAELQNVKPMADVESLLGGWPGDVDDSFEEAIDELRHPNTVAKVERNHH